LPVESVAFPVLAALERLAYSLFEVEFFLLGLLDSAFQRGNVYT